MTFSATLRLDDAPAAAFIAELEEACAALKAPAPEIADLVSDLFEFGQAEFRDPPTADAGELWVTLQPSERGRQLLAAMRSQSGER
jgi:hypothetical protein